MKKQQCFFTIEETKETILDSSQATRAHFSFMLINQNNNIK